MPRKPSIRYYPERKAYSTYIRGKWHTLAKSDKDDAPAGPAYLASLKKFRELLEAEASGTLEDDISVSSLMRQYLASAPIQALAGFNNKSDSLKNFTVKFGTVIIRDLKPVEVDQWLKDQTQWNTTSKNTFLTHLGAALNWAERKKVISKNPLKGRLDKYKPLARTKDTVIPTDIYNELLQATGRSNIHDLILFLWNTGARPSELTKALVSYFDETAGTIRIPAERTKSRRRDRIIHLTPALVARCKELCAGKEKSALIFQTTYGRKWRREVIVNMMKKLKKKIGYTGRLTAYGFRHTFITTALMSTPIAIVAEICGTSVKMITKHYSHPECYQVFLHDHYLRMMGVQS